MVNLDDIIAISRGPCDHIEHVIRVLSLLQDAGATLTMKKRNLFTKTIATLGHVIQLSRPKIAAHLTDAFKELKQPASITELCSFHGLDNLFRWFVTNFVLLASSLNRKLKNDQLTHVGVSSAEKLKAIHKLQYKLVSLPILALLYHGGRQQEL